MPLHHGPRARLLAAVLVSSAVMASVAVTGTSVAASDGAGEGARLNTTTPTPDTVTPTPDTATPTPDTATPYCTGPGCGETPTATSADDSGVTETPTPTPWCTGPGCDDTPSPTPDRGGWVALLRPLATLAALAGAGLLAVGAVLVRWRVRPGD